MSIQDELNNRTSKLAAILADANERITAKNGTAAPDLKNLPDAIGSIPKGSSTGEGGEIQLQAKTAMPTGKTFIVSPDSDYDGLSSVTVVGDANLKAENIAKDVTIYGVTGIHEGDNKVSEVNIYEESGGFAVVFEGGSAVTGSATFDENGLPIGLVADNGSTVNFTAGYPTSVTYIDGKNIPIIWD